MRFWWPIPIYLEHGSGAHVTDIDGNQYIDCNLGFGSMILGHRHPAVESALARQLSRGVFFGAATTSELVLAELLAERTSPEPSESSSTTPARRQQAPRCGYPARPPDARRSRSSRAAGTGSPRISSTATHLSAVGQSCRRSSLKCQESLAPSRRPPSFCRSTTGTHSTSLSARPPISPA